MDEDEFYCNDIIWGIIKSKYFVFVIFYYIVVKYNCMFVVIFLEISLF